MSEKSSRWGSQVAFVSAGMAVVSGVLFLAAADFDLTSAADPLVYLQEGRGTLLRWASLTDMLAYYLLFAAIAVVVDRSMRYRERPDRQLTDLTLVAAVFYSIVGALAAASLAYIVAPLVQAGGSTASDPIAISLMDGIFKGFWQTLESIPAALWWLVVARTWARQRATRVLALSMSIACMAQVVGRMLLIDALAVVGVTIFVIGWVPAMAMIGIELRGEER